MIALAWALETGELVIATGLVLRELLQGFSGAKAQDQIVERFSALPLLVPDREDHVAAAVAKLVLQARRADRYHRCSSGADLCAA